MSAWPHLGTAILGLILVACGNGESPPEVDTCPDNLVTVSVQHPDSAAPTFTWLPPCAVSTLQVSKLGTESQVVWSVSGRLRNIIASGVVYGQLPFGSEEDTAPEPLLAGVSYEVRAQRSGATQSGTGLVGGGAVTFTFTP
jgi:hypothetical protein